MRPTLGESFHHLDQFLPQRAFLVAVQVLPEPVEHVAVGGDGEAARAGRRIANAVLRRRLP